MRVIITAVRKIFISFLIFFAALNCVQSFANDLPNILFIIGDDMGVDALNGFDIGTHLPSTPNLDELRASGVTFTNVWSAPVCSATRASLITGKYGVNNGVNTIVIFLGDNGTPGRFIEGFPENRGKQTIYQGGINVPLIISGKGVSRVNEKEDALINVSDFYITLSQIINPEAFPSGNVFDSYSFKHLLDGSSGTERIYNYMELGANELVLNDMYTTRDAQYKLLDLGNGYYEFHDLSIDTFELNNLLKGTLSEQQANAKEVLFNEMNTIRGFTPEISIPAESPKGKARKYPIVHTGVEEFFDTDQLISTPEPSNVLFWQDAGMVHNAPSYTDNGNNTITDNISGLMWQKDMGEKLSYTEATAKADTLSLGGYTDWRIPTIKELYSLIKFNGHVMGETAISFFIDTDYFEQPIGDVSIGERTIDAQTWSSTHYTGLTMNADTTIFGVNFVDGRIKGYPKYNPRTKDPNNMYFRMVRGNTDYGKNLFTDNGNETVTDSATMLMWQQADDGTARDWLSSIQYCEELTLAGYEDWHLPNAKELQSLVDYYRSPMATNSAAIDSVFQVSVIPDPDGYDGHNPFFWSTSTHQDGPNPYNSAVYLAFGKALGKINEVLMDVHGAGAQRSDPKTGDPSDYPQYHGPQGDLQMVFNHCRCVRNLDATYNVIEEPKEWEIKLYPNPVKNELYLNLSSAGYATINAKLYDLHNKLYINKQLTGPIATLNVSQLREGIFVLICTSGSSTPFIEKVIKL